MKDVLYYLRNRHEIDFVRRKLIERHDDVIKTFNQSVVTKNMNYYLESHIACLKGKAMDEFYISTTFINNEGDIPLDEIKKCIIPTLCVKNGFWKYVNLGFRGY